MFFTRVRKGHRCRKRRKEYPSTSETRGGEPTGTLNETGPLRPSIEHGQRSEPEVFRMCEGVKEPKEGTELSFGVRSDDLPYSSTPLLDSARIWLVRRSCTSLGRF